MSDDAEKTFFEHDDVKVTNARFIVPSQTYAMAGITSVKFFTDKPSKLWPILALLFALGAWSSNANIWTIAVPLLISIALFMRKPTHHVVLSSSSGEQRALNSQDKDFIAGVIDALNKAIISRG